MNWELFRTHAHQVIDDICDYYTQLETRPVKSTVTPGYLQKLLPFQAPQVGESFAAVRDDLFKHIMPGISHWQHPSFFAFYPSNSSPAGMLAEMYSNMFNCVGFNWMCSPAYTELETIVLDWLCKALKLSTDFLSNGKGCGVIQGTASEAVLVAMLAARKMKLDQGIPLSKLCFYCSDQTHACCKKASTIGLAQLRVVKTDQYGSLQHHELEMAIAKDIEQGFVPFFVVGTYGTTTSGAIDDIEGIGRICEKYDIWFHIDAAYAGSFLLLDEFYCPTDKCESFNMNCHKFMLVNFDCSPLWIKDRSKVIDTLSVAAPYYRNVNSEKGLVTDFRDLQLPLGRRFRSLKLWFVMRLYGIEKLQEHVLTHLNYAIQIENKIKSEPQLQLIKRDFALVTFTHVDESKTRALYDLIQSENVYITCSKLNDKEILRFVSGSPLTLQKHVNDFWAVVRDKVNMV